MSVSMCPKCKCLKGKNYNHCKCPDNRGGFRPGSGRKKTQPDKITISFKVEKQYSDKIKPLVRDFINSIDKSLLI